MRPYPLSLSLSHTHTHSLSLYLPFSRIEEKSVELQCHGIGGKERNSEEEECEKKIVTLNGGKAKAQT